MAYAPSEMHTPLERSIHFSRFRFGLLGFGFELVSLSKPSFRVHCSKLHCDRQDSIVIETGDSEF